MTAPNPDPRETLARIRAQADAATEGPWDLIGGGEYVTPVGIMVAPDDGGVNGADAEFIASSRTTVPALLDAIEAVLKIHKPIPCTITNRTGVTEGTVCDHCLDPTWPCPDYTAVTTALEGLHHE